MNRADYEGIVNDVAAVAVSEPAMQSPQTDQLAADLAKAQSAMAVATQSGINPHFKSKYSTSVDVGKAFYPGLNANGLSISIQPMRMDGEWVAKGTLHHKSGQWISAYLPLMLAKRDMQAMKSAMTYAQRTLTIALTGGLSGDDDDGNAACAPATAQEKKKSAVDALLSAMQEAVSSGDETRARKGIATAKLRESEKSVPKGTADKLQKMFDDAFTEESNAA